MTGKESNRRELITTAAFETFTARGFDGTTIGDLANQLGISKAAIAYYFPTKETFLDEFITPFIDELEAATDSASNPRAVTTAYLSTLIGNRDTAVWFDTDPVIQNHPSYGGRLSEVNRRVVATITNQSKRKDDRMRALSVLGGLWRPTRESTRGELESHRREIVDAALAGY